MKSYIFLFIIIAIIFIVLTLIIMTSVKKSPEFAKVKAKTHAYEGVPGFIKNSLKAKNETLPERGLVYYSDIFGSNNGEFTVDVDKKTVKYWIKESSDKNKTGTIKLSDSQVNEIISLVNKIWASESDFESTQIGARATSWHLILVDKGVYRWFEFGGIPSGEAGQLTKYLEDLIAV